MAKKHKEEGPPLPTSTPTATALGLAPVGSGFVAFRVEVPLDFPGLEVLSNVRQGAAAPEKRQYALARLATAFERIFVRPPRLRLMPPKVAS
jgi:hypothetical protein